MLFKIVGKEKVLDTNPEMKSIEEFNACTDRQMRYVMFAYDYKSPLRQHPLDSRKNLAAKMAGYKLESTKNGERLDKNGRNVVSGKVETVEKAIKMYNTLQYNQDIEQLQVIDTQIRQIHSFINREGKDSIDLKRSVELAKELPNLNRVKVELKNILDLDVPVNEEEGDEVVEDSKLSTLDKLHEEED